MKIFRRKDEEAVSPVIAIILMVAITVVLASVLYVWVMNLADTGEEAAEFPTVTVEAKNAADGEDRIIFKHKSGDPIKWDEFKIIIRNASDDTKTVTLTGLTGDLKFGEVTTFTSNSSATGTGIIYASALAGFDMEVDYTYHIEIYDQKDQKIVKEAKDIMCTTLAQ